MKQQRHLSSDAIHLCTTTGCYFPSAINHALNYFSFSCSSDLELAFNSAAAFLHVSSPLLPSLLSISTNIYLGIAMGAMAIVLVLSIFVHPQIEASNLMLSMTIFRPATYPSMTHFVGGAKAHTRFRRRRNSTKMVEAQARVGSSWWRTAEARLWQR